MMLFLKIIFSYMVFTATMMVLLGSLSLSRTLERVIGWLTVVLLAAFPFIFIILIWTLI